MKPKFQVGDVIRHDLIKWPPVNKNELIEIAIVLGTKMNARGKVYECYGVYHVSDDIGKINNYSVYWVDSVFKKVD